ncbi:5-methylcytosine-specific restriction enzyme B [Amycolatopsis lurida]|uniref:AAA+ ATPase domain-containing protein n=1 Tax=Amycolatopsis lurida NRRL 2430 TaxID=1460371 RepID=A0A2P2FGE1_AMYLU|nr:AAA family ATPase [Amycolatopsis lurida]KFU75796.1 hypothetical protein BB31_39505 [Amycolatopsis lurida NRRL 2430]SEE27664.1 5-methylcytosine-specific restriction enzyme B [Amycolatopsis lurida]
MGTEQRSLELIKEAARAILEPALSDGSSAIDPEVKAWLPEVARDLHVRIVRPPDAGAGSFREKLKVQLRGTSRATHLLAAELMYLHVLPLTNVRPAVKLDRITEVLSWLTPPPPLPEPLRLALDTPGAFSGGTGFNVQIWRQIGWLLEFVQHWWALRDDVRTEAFSDPWKFRTAVASMVTDQPGIRNSLLYLAFPDTFLPIVSQDNKRSIRDAFSHFLGLPSGQDPLSVDRDLFAIHQIHTKQDENANYYREPYVSQWRKLAGNGARAWLIRPRDGGRELLEQWLDSGFVSIAGPRFGELAGEPSRADVHAAVEENYQHLDYVQRLSLTTDYHSFLRVLKADDHVIAVDGDRVYFGVVTGGARYSDEPTPRLTCPVAWPSEDGITFEGGEPFSKHATHQGVVVDITAALDSIKEYTRSLVGSEEPERDQHSTSPRSRTLPPPSDGLISRVHGDRGWLQDVIELLEDRRQIVLYGPPGTGKTYIARELAHHLTGADAVRVVQFHPSYAYEDFFEGYRPAKAQDGFVGFELQPGPLRQIVAEALTEPHRPYVLIVDEINRANLAKVFGELYYLLEYRGETVRLQYSPQESFCLPHNLYFIGTMNTADRSIALVDTALRRRFAFVELHPDDIPVRDLLRRWLAVRGKTGDDRPGLLAALNAEIGDEDRDFKIGPAYLMTPDAERADGLRRIWEFSILPLLEEHYYGRLDRQEVRSRFGLDAIRLRAGESS